jgi:hypothetical protein
MATSARGLGVPKRKIGRDSPVVKHGGSWIVDGL